MRDWIGTIAKAVLAVLIAGFIINEVGSVLWTNYQSGQIAQTVAHGAAMQYRSTHSKNIAGQTAVTLGQQHGVIVYGFDIEEANVTVWIRVPPKRTPLVILLDAVGSRWDKAREWSERLKSGLTADAKQTSQAF